ncbi:gluconate 2-dehydrogenase subunit 3 family protein [Paenibacillus validus]|uniref:Gluconate 2-dehydrogenase subunit 3 family protein n=1 Tax=Paenibacillus validus TaxID=44253 RepID=A0A7X2ZBC1_9BACL|nr:MULTISPECIES: gluconate 2-dehydrogenase subunit 3 family protein [Paenibacillus]MED4600523.1 gluconate 2-dehydrogenase subunit 3 family protein [Paenibacillus validus]MED4604782.1 gluconate 2-dehydrogenase subunit 3 family protein [Paenibacillus validus]MUG70996.1 gluconate 2-dehydrogenase subunit 3 family protein [Paenibacillus validus]
MTASGENVQTYMFFNDEEAGTIEAITARIIPSDPLSPGAREAGAVIYIDRALGGYFSHLQTFYRQGITAFDRLCQERYGAPFVELTEEQQDGMLHEIEGSLTDEEPDSLAQFFAVVYEHTLEGTFGDPLYGGNRDAVGWKLVGFPGAQWGYTAEQMQLGYDAKQMKVLTLADLRQEANRSAVSGVKP